jgi:hypothetical protein
MSWNSVGPAAKQGDGRREVGGPEQDGEPCGSLAPPAMSGCAVREAHHRDVVDETKAPASDDGVLRACPRAAKPGHRSLPVQTQRADASRTIQRRMCVSSKFGVSFSRGPSPFPRKRKPRDFSARYRWGSRLEVGQFHAARYLTDDDTWIPGCRLLAHRGHTPAGSAPGAFHLAAGNPRWSAKRAGKARPRAPHCSAPACEDPADVQCRPLSPRAHGRAA